MIDLKEIFINATSPNTNVRSEAESLLKSFTKRPGFIIELTNFFNDPDVRIKLISSIFFKNFTIAEWAELEFLPQKSLILQNIVVLYASADKLISKNLEQLIEFVLEKEDPSRWTVITEPCMRMLQDQSNIENVKAALRVIACLAKNDSIKYDGERAQAMIGPIYPFLVNLLQFLTERREYEGSKIIMKMITNLQDPYISPQYLECPKTISDIYRVAMNVINIEDETDNAVLYKYKKWCAKFFTRIFAKFCRNRTDDYKNTKPATNHVLDQNNAILLFNLFIGAIKWELRNGFEFSDPQENYLNAIIAYLNAIVSEKKIECKYIESEVIFIIFYFILPQMIFNSVDEERFNHEPQVFLREKYNYYAIDLRGFATLLFGGIMKRVKNHRQLKDVIFTNFLKVFDEYNANPTLENAKRKYGALQLVTTSSKFVLMNHDDFINKYLIPDFKSPYKCLRSQACFSLQNFREESINNDTMNLIFDGVVYNLHNEDVIIRAEALLAVQFLMTSKAVYIRLKGIVQNIILEIIEVQSKNQIEALDDLLKNVTVDFPDEICIYFPKIVELYSKTIIDGINNINEDNIGLFSSHIESILYLLDALMDKQELIYNLFCISEEMFRTIFNSQVSDLYVGAIELFSEIVVSFGGVDDKMCKIFSIVMTLSDDYKYESASFLVSLIDNFVSFGKEKVYPEVPSILNFIKILCKPEDDCYMDDEYQYGCQIIDSLLLNHNNSVSELIPYFIDNIMHHYHEIDPSTNYIVFHLDSLLNCFIVNFSLTWSILSDANHTRTFFNDLFNARNKFIRVFDKKLVIIFMCIILKADAKLLAEIDVQKCTTTLMNNLETLPEAMEKRQKLIEKKSNEEDDEETENEDEEELDDYYDDLRENEYVFTPIDHLNVFSILNNSINSLGSFGVNLFNGMSEKNRNSVKDLIMKYA